MFYYLLYNSSFIKKKETKEKTLYTLIYGSIVYIILHAIMSLSFKTDIIKYFWFIFLIDCGAMFIISDFNGFSSLNIINYNKDSDLKEVNLLSERDTIINRYLEKHTQDKEENPKVEKKPKLEKTPKVVKKKPKLEKKVDKKVIEKIKKTVSFKDSTPISILKNNAESEVEEEYNEEEADNINLTLENLENLELGETKMGSNSISDLQNNFLKKKMEDEYSDPGSDIDLEQFEQSLLE